MTLSFRFETDLDPNTVHDDCEMPGNNSITLYNKKMYLFIYEAI